MTKIFNTELYQRGMDVGLQIMGLSGQLRTGSKWANLRGRVATGYLDSPAATLMSGTSEILRTVLSTMGLGLPRR